MTMIERPDVLPSSTKRYDLPCGHLYVTITFKGDKPFEVFAKFGQAGNCLNVCLEGICILMSIILRSGVPAETIVEHVKGLQCQGNSWISGKEIHSCPDAIADCVEQCLQETPPVLPDELVSVAGVVNEPLPP